MPKPGFQIRKWATLSCLVALLAACGGASRKPAPLTPHAAVDTAAERQRDAWQQPQEIVDKMLISQGMRVVDLGAGNGYLLPFLSRAVGPAGVIYAVEVQPEAVRHLQLRVAQEQLRNVVVVPASEAGVLLPEPIDRAVLLHSYSELARPIEMLRSLKAWLRPGGRVFVVEFLPPPDPTGAPLPLPAPEHRIAPDTLDAEARGAGLVITQHFAVLTHQLFAMLINAEELMPASAVDPATEETPTQDAQQPPPKTP